ncbi:MAG: universal stress protein UspA [Firmicutes bacterium]|jgi:K+-sensing histidine kinase KdpD|nr:universal stress protein UspA [Bacillota bacterium]NBI64465.1 universal stress protein UspA [Clostridiales bacterium]
MKHVMVCVTQQKTCDRLIRYGHGLLDGQEDELFIIHVAPKDFKILGSSEEGEALDYLYGKAIDYGANLTVLRSNNILDTLVDLVGKNQITHVVLGQAGQVKNEKGLITKFGEKISGQAELIIVP